MKRYAIVLFLSCLFAEIAGGQWKKAVFPATPPTSITAFDFWERSDTLFTLTDNGVHLSVDRGQTWTRQNPQPPPPRIPYEIGSDTFHGKVRIFANGGWYRVPGEFDWTQGFYFDQYTDGRAFAITPSSKIINDPVRGTMMPSRQGMIYPMQIVGTDYPNWWRRDQAMKKPLYKSLLRDSVYLFSSQQALYTLRANTTSGWDSITAGLFPSSDLTSLIDYQRNLIAGVRSVNTDANLFRLRADSSAWERVSFLNGHDPGNVEEGISTPVYAVMVVDSFLFIGIHTYWGDPIYYCPLNQVVGDAPGIQYLQKQYWVGMRSTDADIKGVNFYPDSRVFVDNEPLDTRYVHTGLLTYTLPESLFREQKIHLLKVYNPEGGGFYSKPETLRVRYMIPTLDSIAPRGAYKGTSPVIRVYGKYFYPASRVIWFDYWSIWGFDTLSTTFISHTLLEARPSALQMSVVADPKIQVWNPSYPQQTSNRSAWFHIMFDSSAVGVHEIGSGMPVSFALSGNYPNPFNPKTALRLAIPNFSRLRAVIYDMRGREVELIADEPVNPGWYELEWNADGYASGSYLLRVTAGEFTATRRLLLVK